jgi:hypothetical protein
MRRRQQSLSWGNGMRVASLSGPDQTLRAATAAEAETKSSSA